MGCQFPPCELTTHAILGHPNSSTVTVHYKDLAIFSVHGPYYYHKATNLCVRFIYVNFVSQSAGRIIFYATILCYYA